MRLIQLTLLILSTICLSACVPEVEDKPQCSPFIAVSTNESGKKEISYENSYCRCRDYHFGMDHIGPVSKSEYYPIEVCHKIIGWAPKDYSIVWMFWEDVRKYAAKKANK